MVLTLLKRHPSEPYGHGRSAWIARGHGSEGVQTGSSYSGSPRTALFDDRGRRMEKSFGSIQVVERTRAGIEASKPNRKQRRMMGGIAGIRWQQSLFFRVLKR